MPDPFEAREYLSHLRRRWRLPAVALAVTVTGSLAVSLLLPRRYTARVRLVIEPPAGSDVRASTAVSPIYLESLRTYEHLASSDRLFAQAAQRFRLRNGNPAPIEKLKRQVLKVSIARNTKVMEIAATLPDPKQAHAVATYIAEETVRLNRQTNRAADEELIRDARGQVQEAVRRLGAAEAAYLGQRKRTPSPESLRSELDHLREIRVEAAQLALAAEISAADLEDRSKAAGSPAADKAELADLESRAHALRNRAGRFRKAEAELESGSLSLQKALSNRTAEIEAAEAQLKEARTLREQAEARLLNLETAVGLRGERLNLLDAGVPPERPSSPNLPLNLAVAAGLGLFLSLMYLSAEYGLQASRPKAASEDQWITARR